MLDIMFRIIIAGSLLFGSTFLHTTAQAAPSNRVLPHDEQPVKGDPCRATWPYAVRTCTA